MKGNFDHIALFWDIAMIKPAAFQCKTGIILSPKLGGQFLTFCIGSERSIGHTPYAECKNKPIKKQLN